MWKYNSPDELYHAGVLGMKWGHRNPSRSDINKANFKAAKKRINEEWNKAGKKYDYGESKSKAKNDAYEKAADKWAADRAKAKAIYKTEKRNIRGDINAETRRQNDESSFLERITYNDATRRRAGKLVVEKNMTRIDAASKAKKEAWRNSGLLLAGTLAAITIANKRR